MYHWYGNVSCKGVNVSNNQVREISGIYIGSPSISSISFSSFRNNKATSYSCIWCYSSTHYITDTNIIQNEQTSSGAGIINAYSATISMTHCSIFGNKPGDGVVFYGSITGTQCSTTSDQMNSNSGSLNLGTTSESFINYYEYLELDECRRGLDAWSDIPILTPSKPQSPKETPEQTPRLTPTPKFYTYFAYSIFPKTKHHFFIK